MAKNDQNKHTLHEEFKKYCNTILKLTKINKSKHYQTFFLKIRTLKKIWEGIKSIINISKKSNKTINCIKLDDQEVTNPFEIAHSFNQRIRSYIQIPTKTYSYNPASDLFYLFIYLFTLYLTLTYKLKIHTFISKLKF